MFGESNHQKEDNIDNGAITIEATIFDFNRAIYDTEEKMLAAWTIWI
ncbi:hypothetical protein HY497_02480 [Candidatus Woesearchaeota archaeon]|nr:hypothetical protein [Candidatus Woesearchaeota archaeon]